MNESFSGNEEVLEEVDEMVNDVKVEVVSLRGHLKALAIAILFVVAMSVGCVLVYHNLVLKSVEEIVLDNKEDIEQIVGHLRSVNGKFVMIDGDMRQIEEMLLYKDFQLELLLRINQLQNEELKKHDRRHLEVIRALAILQKDHWPVDKILESSGYLPGITWKDRSMIRKSSESIPEEDVPQDILKGVEEELKNW